MVISKAGRVLGAVVLGVGFVCLAVWWRGNYERQRDLSSRNYEITYKSPKGWVPVAKSPECFLACMDPKTRVVLRGSINQVEAEVNPSPELDRDGLTQQFAQITRDNLGWKAEILDVVPCISGSFRLIRRTTVDRTIVSAIAVKGNTTILITLAAIGKAQAHVDEDLPAMRDFLSGSGLHETVLQ